jgi:ribosomal protein L7Ae-like RNA K-turn-binding protein
MKELKKMAVFLAFISGFYLLSLSSGFCGDIPKAKLPVLTTSAGQSSDVETLNVIMEEAGIPYDYCDVPSVELLSAGVGLSGKESAEGFHVEVHTDLSKFPKGTPYRTVIFAIGATLKGMGASGLTVDTEEARLKSLVDLCKKNGIFIIAVHAGGESKRGAPGSDNERMIDAIAPFADYLIVTADSNKDGRFTKISDQKKIPLTTVDYALGIVDILKKVFQ